LNYTVCVVTKIKNVEGIYQEFGMGANYCDFLLNAIIFYSSGNYYMYLDKGCDGQYTTVAASDNWYSFIFTITYYGSYSTIAYYINNTYIASKTLSAVNPTSSEIHLYRFNGATEDSYLGGIYIYDKILNETEMDQLNAYVIAKYGITT
jgi:hypothetical protein